MSKCYAVLWIPTVNHIPIPFEEPHNDGVKIADISDIIKRPFKIKIQTNGKNIDILTQNEKETDTFDSFITLHFEKFSHNGMIKYSFEPKFFENGEFGFDDESFPGVVYHIIKEFYHIHEFHENETDSSLLPYLSKNDINIGEPDNEAIKHYLKNFEKIILVLVNLAKEFSNIVQEKGKKDSEFVQKDFDTFFKMYIMVRGYDAYLHSLYKSIYNKKCHISNENEKELRRCAFNIENSVRYFNVLHTFFDTQIRKNNTFSILKNVEENLRKSEENLSRVNETLDNSKKSLETSEQTLKTTEETLKTTEETLKTSELTLKSSNTNIEKTKEAADDSTKWAIRGIIFSAILSIVSISYSICLSNQSSKELKETSTKLEHFFKNSMETTEQILDSVMMQMPTKSELLRIDSILRNNIPHNSGKGKNH
ncbi:MAG: hypothetical protein K2L45_11680 [Muribaculaceae bacterium]|nr:hypothetical protein [Muribaculaceae bacterium]